MTTWLMQPLDGYAFSPYKHDLHSEYQAAQVDSTTADVDISAVLRCIGAATEHVLQTQPWGDAFRKTGFGSSQNAVAPRVLESLGLEHAPLIPHTKPSEALVALCLPRRSNAAAGLMKPHEVTMNPPGSIVSAAPAAGVARVEENEDCPGRVGRTRSQTWARTLLPRAMPLWRPARSEFRVTVVARAPVFHIPGHVVARQLRM